MALKAPVQEISPRHLAASTCASSSPSICSIDIRKWRKWHSELSGVDKWCSSSVSSCNARVASSNFVYSAGTDSAELELSTSFWTGGMPIGRIYFQLNESRRKVRQSNCLTVTARSKTKKNHKEAAPIIPQRELLAQVRSRKKLAWLQREQELTQEDSEVEKVWPFWRKKKKSELESRAMTLRIMELGRRQQLHQVFHLLEEAAKQSETPSIIIMNAVLDACVHCNEIDRAIAVYQEMIRPGRCGVDNITYGTLLKGLGKAQRLDDAFELTEAIEAGRVPGNPILSDVHLNTLVNACVEAGDSLRARGVLLRYRSSMKSSRPSILTYNLLIKGFARSDNPLGALKLKDEMLVHELQPQRLTYNSLIYACVRGGDMTKALELFNEMKVEARRLRTSRLLPDVVTYTTLLKGLADHGDIERVSSLISEMEGSPTCVLDRVAYTAIIDAYIAVGVPQEGMRVMEEMKERGKADSQFKPKAHAFLALMRAFAEKGDFDVVGSLKRQMLPFSAGNVCVEDRAEADELMVETALNAGKLGVAKQLLKTMVGIKKGIPLSRRAHMVVVRLQTLLGFSHDLFKPFFLKPGISPYDAVETIMAPYQSARPVLGHLKLRDVVMRFLKEDAVPIVDEKGACMGVVNSEDCFQLDDRLCDIMKGPPPEVTASTLIGRAVTLLLEPQVKMVVVVNSRTTYSAERSFSKEVPVGFITRETIFSLNDHFFPVDTNQVEQSKVDTSSQV